MRNLNTPRTHEASATAHTKPVITARNETPSTAAVANKTTTAVSIQAVLAAERASTAASGSPARAAGISIDTAVLPQTDVVHEWFSRTVPPKKVKSSAVN